MRPFDNAPAEHPGQPSVTEPPDLRERSHRISEGDGGPQGRSPEQRRRDRLRERQQKFCIVHAQQLRSHDRGSVQEHGEHFTSHI